MTNIDKAAVLSWFTGKSLAKATAALDAVLACEAQGFWSAGVSRPARAALSKANLAQKIARKNREVFFPSYNGRVDSKPQPKVVFDLGMALSYGFAGTQKITAGELETSGLDGALLEAGTRFVRDMAPVAATFARLDALRPPPVFTSLGVSPTVTSTLERLSLNPATVRICPMEFVQVDGRMVCHLLWPKGTVHNASHYYATANNSQCQACGHAIKNPFNWSPLIVDSKAGVPYSMWVGRDCAHNLFGIKITGDAEYTPGSRVE